MKEVYIKFSAVRLWRSLALTALLLLTCLAPEFFVGTQVYNRKALRVSLRAIERFLSNRLAIKLALRLALRPSSGP